MKVNKTIKFDDVMEENTQRQNPKKITQNHPKNTQKNLDCLCRILIFGRSGLVKTNTLLSLIKHQEDDIIYKIYLYAKYPHKAKYQ